MADDDEPLCIAICDGDTLFADAPALFKRLGADYISQVEGGALFVGISGRGEVPLAKLLEEERAAVRPDSAGAVVQFAPRGNKPA